MRLRSLLFVPGDRPDLFPKALTSGADALILDLEDAVAAERKPHAREAVAEWLAGPRRGPALVRINGLISDWIRADLDAILPFRPDGLVLPKAEGAASVEALHALMGEMAVPILPIATETPASIFQLGSYAAVAPKLLGLTWGVEDLSAAVGARTPRLSSQVFTPPYELARSLALFAAHNCELPAIDTVFTALDNTEGLSLYLDKASRDGFTGMLAIHPRQVTAINAAFTPSEEDRARAQAVLDAFNRQAGHGVVRLDGEMLDAPHLLRARRILDNFDR